ncbi:MAG: HEAT repeat domain-containing protein [Tepidisphaeraceae bacterium]
MPIQGRILGSLALLSLAAGCTVSSTSGDGSMPVDLRSSADLRRPTVGKPDAAATQPGYFDRVGQLVDVPVRKYFGTSYGKLAEGLSNKDANIRRSSLLGLSTSYGARDTSNLAAYRAIGQFDPDPLVRAAAIRAINISRDNASGPTIVSALKDGHPAVQLEVLKALANMPQAGVDESLRKIVADENIDIDNRIAAADALRHYRSVNNARALIDLLDGENFGLAWQARRSLYLMTGKDFRYNRSDWLGFITGPGNPVG